MKRDLSGGPAEDAVSVCSDLGVSAARACLSALLLGTVLVCAAIAQSPERPGPRPDGSILLPNGWSLRPHGRQIPVPSDLPVRLAWHPAGRFVAVQHAGYRRHLVTLVDAAKRKVVGTLPIPKSWSGMAFSIDGKRLHVSGGVEDLVHVFAFDAATGQAKPLEDLAVGDPARLDLVAGLCPDGAGGLFVCLQRTARLVHLDADGRQVMEAKLPSGSMPFDCLPGKQGRRIFVSLWGRARVWAIDAKTGARRAEIETGSHPSELLLSADGKRLFVSNGNENTVSVIDLARDRVEETLSSALFPLAPPGSTPNSLTLDEEGRTLLVANADNNDCAVLDVSVRGHARSLGFIPLGAYPTAIRFRPGGHEVWVANGKGSHGSHANPKGPQPRRGATFRADDYTGSMFSGSLSVFDLPSAPALRKLSALAHACAPLRAAGQVRDAAARGARSPIPTRPGAPTPIRHCVLIIKENRTFDQVFGAMEQGNGDPALCLFGEKVTPNHHAIARAFVLLDNFYVDSEVSADGHEWTMGAYASDFVERTWPVTYGGKGAARIRGKNGGRMAGLGYPGEGLFKIAMPKNGYLFDLAKAQGLSYRSYGEFVQNGRRPGDPGRARIAALQGHFDPAYRGFDLDFTDRDRAARFLTELEGFERRGQFPRLVVMRLPNDHTSGTVIGKPTPRAYVADNDLALGRVLEGLSHSGFWPSMAIFVVEDDAQNGPDHVDAHRTVALVAGPFVKRHAVVSTMYSTASMLRTIELICGLPPMSQFDAAARPMFDCFTDDKDPAPYTHRPATWPLDERNDKTAWGARRSSRFDLSTEDAADDLLFNEVIWRSIKGAGSPMPMPRRAAFVRGLPGR